ncbi:MAG: GntR family transcriptional regulator [Muribaculaceae bacterium]|nr:GntR family transcriptional regulator [Muribaculaceae bacterium]
MDFNENKPIYLQLADQIMDATEQPDFQGGGRLLSVREYAGQTGVNANTVMRAYTWLQQEEIIYNKRGIGYFYSEDAQKKVYEMRREYFVKKEMPYLIERMKSLNISLAEFENLYNSLD